MAQKFKKFEQLSQNKEPVTMTIAKTTNKKLSKEDAKTIGKFYSDFHKNNMPWR